MDSRQELTSAPAVTALTFLGALIVSSVILNSLIGVMRAGQPSQWASLFHLAVLELGVVGGITWLFAAQLEEGRATIYRAKGTSLRWYAVGLVTAPLFVALMSPILDAWAAWFGLSEPTWYASVLPIHNVSTALGVAISVGLMPAIFEELAFRGYVQQQLSPLGPWAAIVLQAALFTVFHVDAFGLPAYIASGLLLGALRYVSGAIWPGVVFHAVHNLTAVADYNLKFLSTS